MGAFDVVAGRGELADVTDPALRASYLACKRLNARHGRTYFLATYLLPAWKRRYVHALYGFARYADEIVDDRTSTATGAQKAAHLAAWGDRFLRDARAGAGSDDPICRAVVDTVRRWDIPLSHFADFLAAMRTDLTVTGYATYDDLLAYVHGSAGVIGWQMVPILEPSCDVAYDYAYDLGVAFQLANFIRDVGEDLRRGRVYLPAEDLDLFGVTVADLASGVVGGRVRRLLAFETARARELFAAARPGIRLLHPTSRACVETAFVLYGGILDEVERAGYRVLDRRVRVGSGRRAAIAGAGFLRARRALVKAGQDTPDQPSKTLR